MAGGITVPFIDPIVLITRPAEGAQEFDRALRAINRNYTPIFAPAFGFDRLDYEVPEFESAIFSSRMGVESAPSGARRIAWCVGDATATAAEKSGFASQSAGGNAEDLVKMILRARPASEMVHFRGETSKGNITERLLNAGLRCSEVITYRKKVLPPPAELIHLEKTPAQMIVPLFSAETVSILAEWGPFFDGAQAIAISADVAAEANRLTPAKITISERPTLSSMTQAVAVLIA